MTAMHVFLHARTHATARNRVSVSSTQARTDAHTHARRTLTFAETRKLRLTSNFLVQRRKAEAERLSAERQTEAVRGIGGVAAHCVLDLTVVVEAVGAAAAVALDNCDRLRTHHYNDGTRHGHSDGDDALAVTAQRRGATSESQ